VRSPRRLAALALTLLAACSTSNPPTTSPPTSAPETTASTSGSATTPPTSTTSVPTTPATTVATTAASPSPEPSSERPDPVPLPGLPEQGVAVERGNAVDLHNLFTGKLVAHLDGFSIYGSTDAPGHLVLVRRGVYYLLEEFERALRPLASRRAADRILPPDQELDLPPPESGGRPMTGHWRYQMDDPHYEGRVLAQWSGECEVPTAFFVEVDDGEIDPITGEEDPAEAPESFGLGWTKAGQAVAFLPEGACGSGMDPPGIYLFRKPGPGRLLVETPRGTEARMWGNTIAD
jgi:hypothetical protein